MGTAAPAKRFANWDLLRAAAMFFVVVVHSVSLLAGENSVPGFDARIVLAIAILCDPVFFMLSGFFAIRPMKRSLKDYYLNKVSTIILPLVLYAILIYTYELIQGSVSPTLDSFFAYFAEKLAGAWWFIPALVPCLVAAPFISKGFERLSDKQVFALGSVLMALFLWGLVMTFIGWVGGSFDIPILSSFSQLALQLVPAGLLTQTTGYFQFFIMGGVFGRLAPHLRGRAGTAIIVVGAVFLVQDVVFRVTGLPRSSPSYSWLFVSFAIMVAFDRISITAKPLVAAITWMGKRSYTIYLLHFGMLKITIALLFQDSLFGPISATSAPVHIALWVLAVLCTYLSALAAASVCDPLLLGNLQKLFGRLFIRQRATSNPEQEKPDETQ